MMNARNLISLRNWLAQNDFRFEEPDAGFYAANLDDLGLAGASDNGDWHLWIGRECVIRNTIHGTRSDSVDRYVARSWPGSMAIADATTEEGGLTRAELAEFVCDSDARTITLHERSKL
jgi:hypothetical protein